MLHPKVLPMIGDFERTLLGKLLPREGNVVNFGVSDREMIQELRQLRPELRVHESKDAIALDHFCTKERIRRISFLNLGIQGRELATLRTGIKLLQRQQIDLIRFTHGPGFKESGTNLYELFAFLIPFQYRLFKITPDKLDEKREILPPTNHNPPAPSSR